MAFMEHKAAIPLKRENIEKKLLWKAYRNSPALFQMVPSATPYGLPFPRIGVCTPPKTPIAIIPGTDKATNFKFGEYIQRVHPNKSPLIFFGEKGAWAFPGTAQFFRVPPIISGTGKATDLKFGQYIQRVHPNKSS